MARTVRASASLVDRPVPESEVSGLMPNSDAPAMRSTMATMPMASTMKMSAMITFEAMRRPRVTGRASR